MITSTKNERIKELVRLQKSSKERNEADVLVLEGIRMLSEIAPSRLKQVYVSESCLNRQDSLPIPVRRLLEDDCLTETVSDHVFEHISDTQSPQGILGVVRQEHFRLTDLTGNRRKEIAGTLPVRLLVAERLQNPGNLGTMFRTGEAAGITGLIISADSADVYNPKTIRASMGSVLRLPYVIMDHIPDAIRQLQKEQIRVYATHLEGSVSYEEVDYAERTALLIGNEGNGLTKDSAMAADLRIRIPMEGRTESLNASIAASVILYEMYRQRRTKGRP